MDETMEEIKGAEIGRKYRKLSNEVLNIYEGRNGPKYVIQSVDSFRKKELMYCWRNGLVLEAGSYDDFLNVSKKYSAAGLTLSYYSTVSPLLDIPKSVEYIIKDTESNFDEMKVLWEANWQTRQQLDPILIGIKKGEMYVVTQWDTSKWEDYIIGEFTL